MKTKPTVEVYCERAYWRWRLVASNGKVVAAGTDEFSRRRKALESFRRVGLAAKGAKVSYLG